MKTSVLLYLRNMCFLNSNLQKRRRDFQMIINIFLYTTDEQTAIDKTKEILSLLEIKDIVSISSEPYWKYSDMTVTHTEIISNIYPDKDVLKRIADAIIVSAPALRNISTTIRPSHSSNPSAKKTIAFIVCFSFAIMSSYTNIYLKNISHAGSRPHSTRRTWPRMTVPPRAYTGATCHQTPGS